MRTKERIPLHAHTDHLDGGRLSGSAASSVPDGSIPGGATDPVANDTSLITVAATGATETVDVSAARTYDLTLDANCTLTLTGAVTGEAWFATVLLRQDGTGGWTVTWPGSVTWMGGVAPVLQTAPGAVDVVTLFTLDGGTVWYGATADSAVSSHLSDPTDAHDASAISVLDTGGYFTGTDVEAVLAEIGAGGLSSEDTSLSAVGASGTTETIDCSTARVHDLTLSDNCTITLTGAYTTEAHFVTIALRQDATGSRTVTWPASVEWPGNSAPTLTTTAYFVDIVRLLTVDGGSTWFGMIEGQNYQQVAPPAASGGTFPLVWLHSNL